ncbi:MAG: methyltransferase domain-containing protein [Syntrophobacterales bacterium]|jgi:cyclopropane fatty-acyl-phospholipid synthase-like methyltransferase|nr:methyltransferase domain-containing protein [Syntrophobacterales bacterium]
MLDYRQRIYQQYLQAGASAPASEKLAEFQRRAPYLERLIRDHFPENRETAILDLGCGAGAMEYFARRRGYKNIVGIDCSPQQVAAARSLGLTGVREGNLRAAIESLEHSSQGLLIAFDVLEHFRKEEILEFMGQVNRVLAAGGKVILHVPNGASPFGGRVGFGDFTHETMFTRDSLEQILTCTGFSRIECYEDQPVVHGLASGLRWLLWRLFRGGLRLYLAVETGSLACDEIFSQNMLCVAIK